MTGNGAATDHGLRTGFLPYSVVAENQRPDDKPVDNHLDLAKFTPRLIAVLSNIFSQRESMSLRQTLDLGTTDWRIIAALAQAPALTATEISRFTVMSKAVISRALANLIEQDLITQGDGPRGSRPLRLTERGVDVYREMLPIALRAQRLIERTITREELEFLEAILMRLVDATADEQNWE